ncbi:MAG: nuclease [Gammaproteobacteria bacterium]|jgi:hypothetical protein|nr:nuclease [Gammaproteobacteria bacterium]
MKKSRFIVLLTAFCFSWITLPVYAWNLSGHAVVAQIAYDNLTSTAKAHLAKDLGVANTSAALSQALQRAAVWPDRIKEQNVTAFNNWHWIDLPYDIHQSSSYQAKGLQNLPSPNVVWAIEQAQHVLISPTASRELRHLFLRFLIHFTGDIHQPLHCISYFSANTPQGDGGGNLFPIQDKKAANLHALWDNGVGGLTPISGTFKEEQFVRSKAGKLQKEYPLSSFKQALKETDPGQWAEESYQLAIKQVYTTSPGKTPAPRYYQEGRALADRQLTLAGYRLAVLLNRLYG